MLRPGIVAGKILSFNEMQQPWLWRAAGLAPLCYRSGVIEDQSRARPPSPKKGAALLSSIISFERFGDIVGGNVEVGCVPNGFSVSQNYHLRCLMPHAGQVCKFA